MITIRRILACLCLLACGPLLAEEGRIPIFEPISLAGATDAISGKYVVTRDIAIAAGATEVITIVGTGSEVLDIDLNGFSLVGGPAGGRVIYAQNVRSLTVRNGTIRSPVQSHDLVELRGDKVVLEDVKMQNGRTCAWLVVSTFKVTDSQFDDCDRNALLLFNSGTMTGKVEDNLFRNVSTAVATSAITVSGDNAGVAIRNNRISSNWLGISAGSSQSLLIENNTIYETPFGGIGVSSSEGCRLVGNATNGSSGGDGIRLTSVKNCQLIDNVSEGNSRAGIALIDSDQNHLERNVVNDNSSGCINCFGIYLDPNSSGNTYGRNTAVGNGGIAGNCPQSPNPACGAPQFCDQGTGNKSFQDNLIPRASSLLIVAAVNRDRRSLEVRGRRAGTGSS